MKPLLSAKIVSNEKITLVEREGIIKNNQANARMFNNFFSNIIANLEIPQYNQIDLCQSKCIKYIVVFHQKSLPCKAS